MAVSTEDFTAIVGGLDEAIPCNVDEVYDGEGCTSVATVIVYWRDPCQYGGKMKGALATPLCDEHYGRLKREMHRGLLGCVGCGRPVKKASHIVKNVEEL